MGRLKRRLPQATHNIYARLVSVSVSLPVHWSRAHRRAPSGANLITPYGGISLAGEGARAYRLGSRFKSEQSLDLRL